MKIKPLVHDPVTVQYPYEVSEILLDNTEYTGYIKYLAFNGDELYFVEGKAVSKEAYYKYLDTVVFIDRLHKIIEE